MLLFIKYRKNNSKARAKMAFFAEKCFLLRHFGTSIRIFFYLCGQKSTKIGIII